MKVRKTCLKYLLSSGNKICNYLKMDRIKRYLEVKNYRTISIYNSIGNNVLLIVRKWRNKTRNKAKYPMTKGRRNRVDCVSDCNSISKSIHDPIVRSSHMSFSRVARIEIPPPRSPPAPMLRGRERKSETDRRRRGRGASFVTRNPPWTN